MRKFLLYFRFDALSFFSGTGSYPPLLKGLQRKKRYNARKKPLKAPNRSMASIA
jgi:hypothetical protein